MKRLCVRKVYVRISSASHSTSCCEMKEAIQAFKLLVIRYARKDFKTLQTLGNDMIAS